MTEPNTPRPETLFDCFCRRLFLALGLGALLAAGAAAGVRFGLSGPSHSVRTRLLVPPGRAVVKNGPILDHQQHQRNEMALAKSAVVLSAALRAPAVANLVGTVIMDTVEPVVWLEQHVHVDFSVAPEIMQISMAGSRTEELKVLVRAIRDAYLTEVVERDRTVRQQRLVILAEWIQKCEDRLKIAREAQEAAIQQLGGKNPILRAHAIASAKQFLDMTERELYTAKRDLRKAKMELAALEAKSAKPVSVNIPEAEVSAEIDRDPEIIALRKLALNLKAQMEGIRQKGLDPEKELAPVQRKLAQVEEQIKSHTTRLREELTRKAQERAATELPAALREQVVRVASLEQTVADLEADRKAQSDQLAAVGKVGDRMELVFDGVKQIEKLHDQFTFEKAALELDLQAPHRIALLEDVTVQGADGRSKWMTAAAVALAVFCFTLFAVAFGEYARTVRNRR